MEKKYEAIKREDEHHIAKSLKTLMQAGDPNAFETLKAISSITIPPSVHQNSSSPHQLPKEENSNDEIILSINEGTSHQ